MRNGNSNKGFYGKNILVEYKIDRNSLINGLVFGTPSSGISAIKLEQMKKSFKNIEEITSNKENPEIKSKQKEG